MTTGHSSRFVEGSLKRANEALRGAKIFFEKDELHGAVSRAYYAVFHVATALVYSRGFRAKTHSGLRSLFGEHIVKAGIMDREFAGIFRDAFNTRQLSDYEVHAEFGKDEVKVLVEQAEHFLEEAKKVLEENE